MSQVQTDVSHFLADKCIVSIFLFAFFPNIMYVKVEIPNGF